MRNVEIKAKVDNIDEVEKRAIQLTDTPLKVINQHDIFFHVPGKQAELNGRLKLRQFEDETGELIYYERPDVQGPKLCNYSKVNLDPAGRKNLREVLTQSNGILGTVEKTRHLYMVGQTRIHIDRVLGLGNFMELEVVLDHCDDPAKGEEIVKKLMIDLGVPESSLLTEPISYKMETKPKSEHLLALKVMRLTRPTLASPVVVTCDSSDLPGNTLNVELKNDCTALQGMETVAVGQFMVLPQSFGNIYLGEIFSSYLCVHNGSNQPVKDVTVKADLQTSTQTIPLSGQNSQVKELAPNHTIDEVIHHEVKETGTHILVCEVVYTPIALGGQPSSFRKFFKFQVVKPLDVKTKFYNAENDEVYVEAQIQNLTAGPICLEKVALESSHLFTVSTLNTNEKNESIYGKVNLLDSGHSRQYLYCLKPQPSLAKDPKLLHNATNIGKLDIVWRSNLGERGRLQTSQLQRMAPDYGDLRVTAKELPAKVYLEEPVNFKLQIINTSERQMDLLLGLPSNTALAWSGISDKMIGALKPGEMTQIPLCLIPLESGLVPVSGLKLTDTFLKRVYELDDLAQIFVNRMD